ncbi:hypothetical protein [Ruegeria hyattellae]|uniref:hypothetical protein n=1 Tax=Ruegeria hyattellae TaxID=3233337 RepID=UPI00355C51DF
MAKPQRGGKSVDHKKEKIKVTTAKADEKKKFAEEVKKRKLAMTLVKQAETKVITAIKNAKKGEDAIEKLDAGILQIDNKIEALKVEREKRLKQRQELHTNVQRLGRAAVKEMQQHYAQVKVNVPGQLPPPPPVNVGTAGFVMLLAAWPVLWKKIKSKLS